MIVGNDFCNLCHTRHPVSFPCQDLRSAISAERCPSVTISHPILTEILKVRHIAAAEISPTSRKGAAMEAYDQGVLDCYKAVETYLRRQQELYSAGIFIAKVNQNDVTEGSGQTESKEHQSPQSEGESRPRQDL